MPRYNKEIYIKKPEDAPGDVYFMQCKMRIDTLASVMEYY
jgi:hypothetical protein